MKNLQAVQPISVDNIKAKIYEFRGQKVMLDRDLAALYQVETKRLNEKECDFLLILCFSQTMKKFKI